jgi:hypothetical protein
MASIPDWDCPALGESLRAASHAEAIRGAPRKIMTSAEGIARERLCEGRAGAQLEPWQFHSSKAIATPVEL